MNQFFNSQQNTFKIPISPPKGSKVCLSNRSNIFSKSNSFSFACEPIQSREQPYSQYIRTPSVRPMRNKKVSSKEVKKILNGAIKKRKMLLERKKNKSKQNWSIELDTRGNDNIDIKNHKFLNNKLSSHTRKKDTGSSSPETLLENTQQKQECVTKIEWKESKTCRDIIDSDIPKTPMSAPSSIQLGSIFDKFIAN